MEYSNVYIAGIGRYLPDKKVSNSAIEKECCLKKNFCKDQFGIRERRKEIKLTQSQMGAIAAREALEDAEIELFDIDIIVSASITFERKIPDNGPLIQQELGASEYGIPSLTIQSGMNSAITALEWAANMIQAGRYSTVMIVTSDITTQMTDNAFPYAKAVYGDGAAAIIVSGNNEKVNLMKRSYQLTDCSLSDVMCSYYGMEMIEKQISGEEAIAYRLEYDKYNKVYSKMLMQVVNQALESQEKVGTAIIQAASKLRTIPKLQDIKTYSAIENYGICGSAALFMTLYELIHKDKIKKGEAILFASIGDGLTASSIIFKYK